MQAKQSHEFYMQRCLQLARLGWGSVSPNPMVGSVIVYNGNVIGEGYHRKYGGPHAEVNAVEQVQDKALLKNATLYVNLEPCSHVGKTPACSDMIIRMGIPRVVIGMQDPFDQVKGAGIAKLKKAGVEVTIGILEKECEYLNRIFIEFHTRKKPWVRVKFAQSANHLIDVSEQGENKPAQITNSFINTLNHRERTGIDAIAIGYNTALRDNPTLTPRYWSGSPPLRIVFDRYNSLPNDLTLFGDGHETWVVTEVDTVAIEGIRYIKVDWIKRVETVLQQLYLCNKAMLLVEGGAALIKAFFEANMVNECWEFTNPSLMLPDGTPAPHIPLTPQETTTFNGQELKRYSLT